MLFWNDVSVKSILPLRSSRLLPEMSILMSPLKIEDRIVLDKVELAQVRIVDLGIELVSDVFFTQVDKSVKIHKQIRVVDKHLALENRVLEVPVYNNLGVVVTVVIHFVDISGE